MPKKKDNSATQALSLRAFIKLLRADKTHDDLDRLKVFNKDGEPITQVHETSTGVILSWKE